MTPQPQAGFDPDEVPPWERPTEGASEVEVRVSVAAAARAVSGGAVLDVPDAVPSRWGEGERSLWARGEPFLLCGPDGVGKTTLAQQIVLHLTGVRTGPLLGLPVEPARRVLYLACDRPAQAMRSFRRMVTEDDRPLLDDRLVVWRGPLPFDGAREDTGLLAMATELGADVLVLDSVKDIAADLSKEEAGQGINMALQRCVAAGIDVLGLHHQRKAQANAGKPKALADVYGSRWITAGAGSVAMLWGEAGDSVVELSHLKQPSESVGPMKIVHDHTTGTTTVAEQVDAWSAVKGATRGITAGGAAMIMFGEPTPDRNAIEKARRQLDRLARDGKVHRKEGARGGKAGGEATTYYPLTLLPGGAE